MGFAGHLPKARTRHWTPAQLAECGVWLSGKSPLTTDTAKIATVQNLAQPRYRLFDTISQDATKNSLVTNFKVGGKHALYARGMGGSARLGPTTFSSPLPQTLSMYTLMWVVDNGTNYIWDGASNSGNNILSTAGSTFPLTLQAAAFNTITSASLPITNPSIVRVNDSSANGAIYLNRAAQVIGTMGTELMDGLSVFASANNVSGRSAMTDLVLVKTQLSSQNDAKLTNWMRDKSALTKPYLTMFFNGDSLTAGQESTAKIGGWRNYLCDVLMDRPVGGKWIYPTGGQTYQFFIGDLHNAVGGTPTNDFLPDPLLTSAAGTLAMNATNKTVTRSDGGSWITDGFYVGCKVKGVGFTNAGNNNLINSSQVAYIDTITPTILSLTNANSMVTETKAGCQIKSTISAYYPGTQSGTGGTYGEQDIIWFMAGTNDARDLRTQYLDPNGKSSAYARYQTIITDILAKNPTASLIVSTLPNINPTGNATWAANIADFNSRLPGIWSAVETATSRTLYRVDLNSIPYSSALWADDVHFNDAGYFEAFKLIYPAVEAAALAQTGHLITFGLDTSGIANDSGGFGSYGSVAGYWQADDWVSDLTQVGGNAISLVNRANRGVGDWSAVSSPAFSTTSWTSGTAHPGMTFNGTSQYLAADSLAAGASGTDTSFTLLLAVDITSFTLGDILFAMSAEDATYTRMYFGCQPSTDATKVRIGRRGDSPGSLIQLTSTNSMVTGKSIFGISFGLVTGTPKIQMKQLSSSGEVSLFNDVTCNAAAALTAMTRWRLMANSSATNHMPGVVKAAVWIPGLKVDAATMTTMMAAMRDNCGCPLT